MADRNRQGDQEVRIVDPTSQDAAAVTSEGRLKVDANISTASEGITIANRPGKYFNTFLTNGGSPYLNVDGSSTPVNFNAAPPSGKRWYVTTISISIEDAAIQFNKFGGITALTNGVDFKVKEGGASELTLGNFKRNGDVYVFATNVRLESAASDILVIHSNIWDNAGTTWKLDNSLSEYIRLTVNDDLTGLTQFVVLVRGYEVDE